MTSYLSATELTDALNLRDLSNPDQGHHAMQTLLGGVISALAGLWGISAEIIRNSPLVAVADNYDKLGFDPASVTRDQRYSRYVSPTVMLRSHTSASIPALLSDLPPEAGCNHLLVLPGLVYRRDAIDRTHVGAPHQVDLWLVSSCTGLESADLQTMIGTLVEAVLPGAQWRAIPAVHPYTVQGCQVDVLVGAEWLELAECGLIAPHILTAAGLDPEVWSGLALGMGLDRALMLRKGVPDIRLLRAADPRIEQQMLNLSPWQAVSVMPPIRRDISIVVDLEADAETLGDRARAALGDRIDDLESVEVLAVTAHADLPGGAQDRLRLRPDQANALVRLTLRPLSKTLTDSEANTIRDDVYRALHEGPVLELIG
ncbi:MULTISPECIES: hypothetical protein [unclassified Cryobacterium]|uniref:PheS-related mystery ligase SrmL n=1 Tax=unclassified Cryobacterium TaxID=2649013 RepID=UPI00106C4434|nr:MULTISPECIES: hypothetical protein [unclassified Cryobacterium]TFC55219.1 hypothetical protein E3O68_07090 [Cryobacterium sp. TMB3-1-2]TFC67639.1 hypothetical protein E3T21_16200 [Cryobacterium sp. TMB3-15]TFC77004.1 hypothetical protein E3T22_06880 [Cryobacterium sp. TMB3-10]TFD44745.1 hypothetical protein E3T58_03740 [Cryobacterium sp. TMB3-12]